MFLKFISENKLVNLNQFDFIEIKQKVFADGVKYSIEACKLSVKLNIDFTYGNPKANVSKIYSDGIEVLMIKVFTQKKDAEEFYKELSEAWMCGKRNVFEIN